MSTDSKPGTQTNFILVIDTNKYAGNFEREMCAYVTGRLGECQVGKEETELFKEETKELFSDDEKYFEYEDLVTSRPDDHGCYRPCSIWQTPEVKENNGYNSVAIFLEKHPRQEIFAFWIERIYNFPAYSAKKKYGEKNLKIKDVRLIKEEVTTTQTELFSCERLKKLSRRS